MYPKSLTDPHALCQAGGSLAALRRRRAWAWVALALLVACTEEKESCSIVEEADGLFLVCGDVRSPLQHHREREPQATVEGRVRLFGREDHAEIEVLLSPTVEGRSFTTRTDASGAYRFEKVPVGRYHLRARAPSYPEGLLVQQLVLGPTTRLDDLVLRSATRILTGTCTQLLGAPSEDAFACLRHDRGALLLWEAGGSLETIAEKAGRPSFSADGRYLFFLDEFEIASQSGTLWIHDREDGSRIKVAEKATSWALAPGGGSLAVRQTGGRLAVWTWRRTATVIGDEVPQWRFSADGAYLLALVLESEEEGAPQLVLWDVDAEAGTSLGRVAAPLPTFGPDGRSFLYRDVHGGTHFFDAEGQGSRFLGSQLLQAELSPDGRAALLRDPDLTLHWVPLGGGEEQQVAERVSWAAFLPGDHQLLYLQTLFDGQRRLAVWHPEGDEATLAVAPWLETPTFAPGGSSLWFRVQDESEMTWSLWAWRPFAQDPVFVTSQSRGVPRFSPDGKAAAFVSGAEASLVLWDLEAWEGQVLTTDAGPNAPLGWFGGSRRLHYVDGRSVLPGLGPLALWDRETARSFSLGEDVRHDTCRFTGEGALLCLARPSPREAGAELIRWDDEERGLLVLADGVTSFGSNRSGRRTLFVTRPLPESEDSVLWLFDADSGEVVPLDDGIERALLGDGWIAWTVRGEGARSGLYVSFYPTTPTLTGETP